MAMPMTGMPASGWKAEGLLGGLYGGMQAQYQSDAMRDATRAAELDHAIKQYELRQKIADEPAVEAERAARITRANEFNTLSPTRIEDAQTELAGKKYTFEQRQKMDKLADAAEFYASSSAALKEAATDPDGGKLSPKYRAMWKEYQTEAKSKGLDIGDEWSIENEFKLHNRGMKATQSLAQLREMQKIMAKGDIEKTINRENAGSHEYIQRMKNLITQSEGDADRQNRLDVEAMRGRSAEAAAAARPRNPDPIKEILNDYRQTGIMPPRDLQILMYSTAIKNKGEIMKDINVKFAALKKESASASTDPRELQKAEAEYQAAVQNALAVIQSASEGFNVQGQPAPTQPTTPSGEIKIGADGKTKWKLKSPNLDATKRENWEEVQ